MANAPGKRNPSAPAAPGAVPPPLAASSSPAPGNRPGPAPGQATTVIPTTHPTAKPTGPARSGTPSGSGPGFTPPAPPAGRPPTPSLAKANQAWSAAEGGSTTSAAPPAPSPSNPYTRPKNKPAEPTSDSAGRASTQSGAKAAAGPRVVEHDEAPVNKNAMPALLCSFFGISAPVGIYLGRKARREIAATGQSGDPYAVAALFIGWAYITAFALGLTTYLIFLLGGS